MHSALWLGDRDMTRELLRFGGAVKMPHRDEPTQPPNEPWAGRSAPERDPSALPAGDPIDYASSELKRLLVKQHADTAAAEEACVRWY